MRRRKEGCTAAVFVTNQSLTLILSLKVRPSVWRVIQWHSLLKSAGQGQCMWQTKYGYLRTWWFNFCISYLGISTHFWFHFKTSRLSINELIANQYHLFGNRNKINLKKIYWNVIFKWTRGRPKALILKNHTSVNTWSVKRCSVIAELSTCGRCCCGLFKTRRAIAAWTHAFTHPCHVLLAFQSTFACHAEQFV